jgi:hypothetical protein
LENVTSLAERFGKRMVVTTSLVMALVADRTSYNLSVDQHRTANEGDLHACGAARGNHV